MLEDMSCPKCGQSDRFLIQLKVWMDVPQDSMDKMGDDEPEAKDNDLCECPECGWTGRVRQCYE